jgi:hypothetical protein
MSALVSDAVRSWVDSGSYQSLSNLTGGLVAILLIALVLQRELLRLVRGHGHGMRVGAFDVAILPLLAAFVLIAGLRVLDIAGLLS